MATSASDDGSDDGCKEEEDEDGSGLLMRPMTDAVLQRITCVFPCLSLPTPHNTEPGSEKLYIQYSAVQYRGINISEDTL